MFLVFPNIYLLKILVITLKDKPTGKPPKSQSERPINVSPMITPIDITFIGFF